MVLELAGLGRNLQDLLSLVADLRRRGIGFRSMREALDTPPGGRLIFHVFACNNGGSGYPLIRLTALVACGTRTVIDAVFGPTATGELTHAHQLGRSLHTGMILLLDRNFAARELITELAATGTEIMVRCKTSRVMPVLTRYPDGSYLSLLGAVKVRVIDAEIASTTGRHTGTYRLATALLDHHRHPAGELVALYHQRWEIETAYLEIKSTILGGRVLRARTPAGVAQEVYALLITYQLLRTTMADATDNRPTITPDRASFSIALHAARDQLLAAGVIADTVITLTGAIGTLVLANLMRSTRPHQPPRRQTSDLQIQRQRHRRPHHLQSHRQHRHPHPARSLTTRTNA